MKHKHPKWLRRLYLAVFSCAIALAIGLFAINFYTTRKAIPIVEAYAARQGIDLKIRKINGWFPIRAEIESVGYTHKGLGAIELQDVTIELYKIPLLSRRLRIRKLEAGKADISLAPNVGSPKPSQIAWPNPFLGIEITKLHLEESHLTTTALKEAIDFSLDASGMIDRGADKVELKATIGQKHPFEETIVANFKALKRTRLVEASLRLSEKSRGWTHFFVDPYMKVTEANLQIDVSGHISSWLSWLRGKVGALSKVLPRLKGSVRGSMKIDPSETQEPWAQALIGESVGLKAEFALSSQQMLRFQNINVKSEAAQVRGSAQVNFHEERVRGANLDVDIFQIPRIAKGYGIKLRSPFACKLKIGGTFDALDFGLSCYKQRLDYAGLDFENISGHFDLRVAGKNINARSEFFCYLQNRRFDLQGAIRSTDGNNLHFENVHLSSSSDTLALFGTYAMDEGKWKDGHVDLNAKRLSFFNELTQLFPNELLVGEVRAMGDFTGDKFIYRGKISQLELGDLYTRTVDFSGEVEKIFNSPRGRVHCDLADPAAGRMQLPSFGLSWDFGTKENSFQVDANDTSSNIRLQCSGQWQQKGPLTILDIQKLDGRAEVSSFALEQGGRLVVGSEHVTLSPTLIQTEGGLVSITSGDKKQPGWQVKFQEVPADLVHLVSTDLSARGHFSGELILQRSGKSPKAHAHIEMQDLSLSYEQWPIIENRSGSMDCSLSQTGLDFTGLLRDAVRETLFFSTHVPAKVSFEPFAFKLEPNSPFHAELRAHESASNFLQYLNSLGHSLGGTLIGEIHAKGSLENPSWSGALILSQGRYENYQTGMILTDVNLDLVGSGPNLDLKTLKAKDATGGHLAAHGTVKASPTERFPFELTALFDKSRVITIDDVKANVSGLAKIEGNLDKAKIEAKMSVTHADISIPDTIKTEPPSLGVEFIHQRKKRYEDAFDFAFAKKVHLNVTLDTASTVEVSGRGLQSKWSGSVSAAGTVADPDFKGKFTLSSGTFKFAKITFNLTEGVISFHGPANKTDISLVAEQAVNDLNVYIALRGPIISPHLTLSSSPDLPLSNLLSRILFNKDISEIDPFQALQLAQTALQISSGEANIMDKIQDSVGLDVFSFTSPSSTSSDTPGENDGEQPSSGDDQPMTVAVQVGKYLTRGVLLTVTQGTTAESSRYNVDVDLKYGLMLQLETTAQRDLKMSLMWSKTY